MPDEKREEEKEEVKDVKIKSDRSLLVVLAFIIILFVSAFSLKFINQDQPETIEDLHLMNYNGKLKPHQGYLSGAHSFVKFEDQNPFAYAATATFGLGVFYLLLLL